MVNPLLIISSKPLLKFFDKESILLTSDSKYNRKRFEGTVLEQLIDQKLAAIAQNYRYYFSCGRFTKELYGENIEDILLLQPTFPVWKLFGNKRCD